jgi:glycosyltransferase involved in cell wall biosynthesis
MHDHTGMLGIGLGGLVDVPFCHTVHGPLTGQPGRMYEDVCALAPNVKLISISENQRKPKPDLPWIANCPNALDLSVYPFRRAGGEYLLFLGRMSPDKGAHRALAVALETGLPLKIAAKCREPLEIRYFDEFIRPHLGGSIEYVGEVGHADKVELLMGARALINPIDWEEPFGLVVIEAMACGTPVIATRRGAFPEIIDHGRTGVLVDNYREMEDPEVLALADSLDPAVLRQEIEERFSTEHMVADYVAAYEATIAATNGA